MPSAQSRRRQPDTAVILPWSNPFFPPQKRRIAIFLQTVNMGISSLPPSLFPLGRNGTTDRVSKAIADAGPTPSWYCPGWSCMSRVPLRSKNGSPDKGRAPTEVSVPQTTSRSRFWTKLPSFTTPPLVTQPPQSPPSARHIQMIAPCTTVESMGISESR